MRNALEATHCCGAEIYQGITYGNKVGIWYLRDMLRCWKQEGRTSSGKVLCVMFDVSHPSRMSGGKRVDETNADKVARVIEERDLGTITKSPWQKNVNSGNMVRTVTIVWNLAALGKWAKSDEAEDPDDKWTATPPAPPRAARIQNAQAQINHLDVDLMRRTLDEACMPRTREQRRDRYHQDRMVGLARIYMHNPRDPRVMGLVQQERREMERLAQDMLVARRQGHRSHREMLARRERDLEQRRRRV